VVIESVIFGYHQSNAEMATSFIDLETVSSLEVFFSALNISGTL
jgi:hypothetical protein